MPFKANVTCNGTYESIYDKFVLSENGTLESNIADLKQIYMGKQLSRSVMEQAIGAGITHFKLSDYIRTPEEQKRCAQRSAKVQQAIAQQLVNAYCPTEVRDKGTVREVICEQPLNAYAPIVVTPSEMITDVMDVL